MAGVLEVVEIAVNAVLRIFEAKVRSEEARERAKAWRKLEAEAAHRANIAEAELLHEQAKRRRRAP